MRTPILLRTLCVLTLTGSAFAQGPAFDSPGLSPYFTRSQTNRFTREFNPAIGFVIDSFADYADADGGPDGFDAQLRILELNGSGFIDPSAWAYVALVAEGEEIGIEEAAVEYIGFEGNTTIKAGRFFVDFGKQMQNHVEELRTLERPLVLREFLGEELAGTGVQFDHWIPLGETVPIRFSLGVFSSLLGEGHHGEEEDEPEPESAVPDRKDIDELSLTARITAMTDVGTSGTLQGGISARHVPEFAFSFDTLEQSGLSNTVYGADVTYGWNDDTGLKSFLTGFEALVFDGDLAAEVDDPVTPTALTVTEDDVFGFFAYADYGWNGQTSAGTQYSMIEEPEDPSLETSELDFYVSHHFTELRRIRLGLTLIDSDLDGDSSRVYLQFTNFFGNHAHALNW